jgi:hypothetical protein
MRIDSYIYPPREISLWTGLPAQGFLFARLPTRTSGQWHDGLSFLLRLRGSGGFSPLFLTSTGNVYKAKLNSAQLYMKKDALVNKKMYYFCLGSVMEKLLRLGAQIWVRFV